MSWAYLHPKFWPTWLGMGLLWGLSKLPYPMMLQVGKGLGYLLSKLGKKRHKIVLTNLKLVFPALDLPTREQLARRFWASFGMGLLESAMAWWGNKKRLQQRFEIDGAEHLHQAVQSGRGVVMLTGHFIANELIIPFFYGQPLPVKTNTAAKRQHNPLFNTLVNRARQKYRVEVLHAQQLKTIYKKLLKKEWVGFILDQDFGTDHAVFVPFMGVPTATTTALSRIAGKTNCLVIPFFIARLKKGKYRVKIYPAWDNYPSGDDKKDAQRYNLFLEEIIRTYPEQYIWTHRRFKARPPGEPAVY